MLKQSTHGIVTAVVVCVFLTILAGCSLWPGGKSQTSDPAKKHLQHPAEETEPEPSAPPIPAAFSQINHAKPSRIEQTPETPVSPSDSVADGPQHAPDATAAYQIQPGDTLTISVWKELDLQAEAVVRPDGGISMPLAGDLPAAGHTTEEVRAAITDRLRQYISDPVVTVAIKLSSGNRIYVVGKVNRPGDFPLTGSIDVMQAIGLAGGTTPFASLNKIRVLRHEAGKEVSIRFRYYDVQSGRGLDQNITLRSGDTVVVP